MRKEDAACRAAEFNDSEWKSLACSSLLAVFLDELAGECEALCTAFKSDVGTLVSERSDCSLNCLTYRELGLNLIPWVRGKLLETEAEFMVSLIEIENLNIDYITRSYKL